VASRIIYATKSYEGSQNFEIAHVTQATAHRGRFMVRTQQGLTSMSVSNLKQTAQFVQKLRGSLNFEIGSRDPKPPPFEP